MLYFDCKNTYFLLIMQEKLIFFINFQSSIFNFQFFFVPLHPLYEKAHRVMVN